MDKEIYKITNLDHVELEFQLAGIGSRFLAGVMDLICMSLVSVFVLFIVVLLTTPFQDIHVFVKNPESLLASVGSSFLILTFFLVKWGYHVVCEMHFQGQSPGKKMNGIQVLSDEGLLPTWKQAAIRNLTRVVDSFPGIFYFVAVVTMGLDPKGKRLGDIAAGTIVVRKEKARAQNSCLLSARAMVEIEKGKQAKALQLPHGSVDIKTLALIEQFLLRRATLTEDKRNALATKIAAPLYAKWGDTVEESEKFLEKIQSLASDEAAKIAHEDVFKEKLQLWEEFEVKAAKFLKKKELLKKLTPPEIQSLINSYQKIVADLARARSMKTDNATIAYLNTLVILGHQLLYRRLDNESDKHTPFLLYFPFLVQQHIGQVVLAALLFFLPAVIAYAAILSHPELGYDLVPDSFLDFSPATAENIHDIPSLTRPVAASGIITNNIQVTFLAFALGITAGLGTCCVLIYNGIHLGAVAAWMQLNGNGYALWGWIMPHGATEILAIILSGAAGLILGNALIRPGNISSHEALKRAAQPALMIELGCMGMLVIAGFIEGFISPSSLSYESRLAILSGSLVLWAVYFMLGRERQERLGA